MRFFALDTDYLDKPQLDWLEKELSSSSSDWKIAFFHHPLYSSGKTHGSALESRAVLEPLFVKYGVSAAFSGHDHFYERIKPQKGGIVYWVSGAGGSLRKGDLRATDMTAKGFDRDYHFMIVEIAGDDLYFQAISRTGATIDSGVVHRPGAPAATASRHVVENPRVRRDNTTFRARRVGVLPDRPRGGALPGRARLAGSEEDRRRGRGRSRSPSWSAPTGRRPGEGPPCPISRSSDSHDPRNDEPPPRRLLAGSLSSPDRAPRRTTAAQAPVTITLTLPRKDGSVRFAVMGDTGTGDRGQYEVAKQMAHGSTTSSPSLS